VLRTKEMTDKDGSAYTVDAPDENAALAAFEAIRHCKRPYAERVRIYNGWLRTRRRNMSRSTQSHVIFACGQRVL